MVTGTTNCRFQVRVRDTLVFVIMASWFVTLSRSFVIRSSTATSSFLSHHHHCSISKGIRSTSTISHNFRDGRTIRHIHITSMVLPLLSLSSPRQYQYSTSTTLSMNAGRNANMESKNDNSNRRKNNSSSTSSNNKSKNNKNTNDELDSLMGDVENLLAELTSSKEIDISQNQAIGKDNSPGIDKNTKNGWVTLDWSSITSPKPESEGISTPSSSPLSNDYSLTRRQDLRHLTGSDKPSPVEAVFVRDRIVYIKRDDLLRLEGSHVSGNKARKMYSLNQIPASDFPDCIVSYGGPQSNAMVALAAIVHSKNMELLEKGDAHDYSFDKPSYNRETTYEEDYKTQTLSLDDFPNNDNTQKTKEEKASTVKSSSEHMPTKKKRFVYYTKKLPRFLRNQPNGNLFRALTLGMDIIELTHEEYKDLFGSETGGRPEAPQGLAPPVPGGSLWIPQGGACGVALLGGRILAEEIVSFWLQQGDRRSLAVLVPGGTCSTALLLHREIRALQAKNMEYKKLDIRVVVIPCVGDDTYARRQMMALSVETGGNGSQDDIPDVLTPIPDRYYVGDSSKKKLGYFNFGEPHASILETFREMKAEGVSLDLLYGAPAWTILLRHWRQSDSDKSSPIAGRELMYVHSGGLEGVVSQLMRYKYKGLVDADEIQLPGKR